MKLNKFLKKYSQFKEIDDLSILEGVKGCYIIVLDEYKQVYIGQSKNIRNRIKQHWSKRKPLNRLVFGSVGKSKISIDSFRALDTTRIFVDVKSEEELDEYEEIYIKKFPNKFICNRISGGNIDNFIGRVLSNVKLRD